MTTLSPELRREIESAGGNPIRLKDPETNTAYVLLKAEEYDRLKPAPGCRKAHALGLKNDESYLGEIELHSSEPEEIEHSFLEFEEFESAS